MSLFCLVLVLHGIQGADPWTIDQLGPHSFALCSAFKLS